MTNRRTRDDGVGDDPMAIWLRAHDPLPAAGAVAGEVETARTRTRAAVGMTEPAPDEERRVIAAYSSEPAPWGTIHVAASAQGIVAIELVTGADDFVAIVSRRLRGRVVPDGDSVPAPIRASLAAARRELAEYFSGRRTDFDLPIDLQGISAWDRLVLAGATRLAYGEVTSYGALARSIGRPGTARAVGGALGRNPVPVVIPCHRILAADGTLGGYGGGGHAPRAEMLGVKRWLLTLEDAAVRG